MIEGTQLAPEVLQLRITPPRAGARPVVLTVGPAPERFQPILTPRQRRYRTQPKTVYWVVAGDLDRPGREWWEYISRHFDFGIATRAALRRANKLAAQPRSKK